MPVPVQIVSGLLGAGKTTALRAQLAARPGQRIAVIVNDFGEAGLDEASLGEDEPFRITNIPGGCVCCTAPEGFVDALGAVLAEAPERLLVEPTGLARPQDLVDTLRRCPHRDAFEIAPLVVLVDPHELARIESEGDATSRALLREQAQAADVLVANRTDLARDDEILAFERYADALWPAPLAVHRTTQGRLPPELLDWPEGEGPRAKPVRVDENRDAGHGHPHGASTAGHRARSWTWSPDVVFSAARLREALERLARGAGDGAPLARFKGVFRTEEGVSRLEIAGGVLHESLTSFRRDSRADAIAREKDAAALDAAGRALEAAVLGEDERRLDTQRIEWVHPDGRVHAVDREALCALPDGVPDVSERFPRRSGAAARVSALAHALSLPEEGSAVVVAGDGFASEPVSLAVLRQGVLLHTLEGAPLPESQGGPFRLLIPEDASPEPVSCANVKGVAKVVIRAGD